MRFGAKMMVWAFCAGSAVAALLVTGSGTANAAILTAGPAGISAGPDNSFGPSGPHCRWWERERWNLNGTNTIVAVYNNTNYYYSVMR